MFAVAHGVVYTSTVKPTQAQHPGTIPKKGTSHPTQSLDCEESIVLANPMSAETFSNIVPVSDLEKNVGSQEELTSKPIHVESTKPPPVPTWPPWSLPPPERDKKSEDMSANDDQGIHNYNLVLILLKSVAESSQSRTLTKKLAADSCHRVETFSETFPVILLQIAMVSPVFFYFKAQQKTETKMFF